MKFSLLLTLLLATKLVFSACDFGSDDSGSSSSSGGGDYSLSPRVIAEGFGTECDIQVSSQCAAADVYYAQYEECVYTYVSDPATQAQCEGYYDNYVIQANLCESVYNEFGC